MADDQGLPGLNLQRSRAAPDFLGALQDETKQRAVETGVLACRGLMPQQMRPAIFMKQRALLQC